jgi:hypothetical protein
MVNQERQVSAKSLVASDIWRRVDHDPQYAAHLEALFANVAELSAKIAESSAKIAEQTRFMHSVVAARVASARSAALDS